VGAEFDHSSSILNKRKWGKQRKLIALIEGSRQSIKMKLQHGREEEIPLNERKKFKIERKEKGQQRNVKKRNKGLQ